MTEFSTFNVIMKGNFPSAPTMSGEDLFSAVLYIAQILIYVVQILWWVINTGFNLLLVLIEIMKNFVTISLQYPALGFINIVIILFMAYVIVSKITIMGSGMGGGD